MPYQTIRCFCLRGVLRFEPGAATTNKGTDMSKRFVVGLAGIALMVAGVFLPFATIANFTTTFFKTPDGDIADGIFILGFGGLALLFLLLKKYFWNLFVALAAGAFMVFKYFQMKDYLAVGMTMDYGWFVIGAGILVLLVSAFIKDN